MTAIDDDDRVDQASDESFPASDAPGWIQGSATRDAGGSPPGLKPPAGTVGRVILEAFLAGGIAYLAVVVVMTVLDLVAGRGLFHTPAVLGSWLLHGGAEGAEGDRAAPIFVYNAAHLLGSMGVALVAAAFMHVAERYRGVWYVALTVLIAATIYAVLVLGMVAVQFTGLLDWTTVLATTAIWIAAMSAYLLHAHPRLIRKLEADSEDLA